MTDDNTAADGGSEDLRVSVTSYGSRPTTTNTAPPELQPYLEQVRKMDPVRDVRGNIEFTERSSGLKLKASALPPEQQSKITRALDSIPNLTVEERAKREHELVSQAAAAKLGATRGLTGVHRDALPVHKEQAQIAMDVHALYQKRAVLQAQVDKVVDVRKVEDPVTGELSAEPVYWLSDHTRAKRQEAIDGLDRDIRLLVMDDGTPGVIGARRIAAAELESAKILLQRATQQSQEAEAQKLADQMVSDERVKQRAEQIAAQKRMQGR